MQERGVLRLAFGKAAGFFYAVVASVVANLVIAYVVPQGGVLEKVVPAPRQIAAVAPLPPASLVVASLPPAPALPRAAILVAPPVPAATAVATPRRLRGPGPGSGGLY